MTKKKREPTFDGPPMMSDENLPIGEQIRAARKAREWTQDRLSEGTGIAQPVLTKYETGVRKPKVQVLGKLARALNAVFLVGPMTELS